MDILIRMLMAVLKDRKHKKQRRVLSTVLAAVVVFMTTYSLILPAITLEESTAETTDGIFLESADVSEADPADDDVDPSGELLLTDDAREESAPASDGWEDGLIEDADWEENGELADIPDEPALTDTGDEATPDGILEEATDAAEAEEDTQALSFTDGELTVRETLVSRQGGEDFLRLTYGAEARIPEDTVCSAQAFIPASSGAAMDEGSSLAEKYEQAAREKAARDYPEWDKIEVRMFDLHLAANGQTVQAENALHAELTLAQPIRSEALLLLHFEDNEAQEELRRIHAGETAGASSVEVHLPEVMHDAEFIRNANGEVYKIRFASQTLNTFAVVIRGESEETENRKEETAHETEPLTEAGTEAGTEAAVETLTESTAAGDETEEAAETETGNVYAETEEATEAVTETASEATEEATEDTTESEESVGEGETESELEEQYPEVEFSDSTQYTQVKVYAPEGAFPEGTQMLLSDVEDDETIAAICDAALAENSLVQKVHAVDISFRNSRNEEIEPLLPIRVEMTAEKCAEVGSSSVSSSVVHVDDSGNATIVENAQKVEAEAEDEKDADKLEDVETIAFEAKEFSVYALVYTVDFHWEVDGQMYEFSLPGGGFISFSDLIEVLGVAKTGENDDVYLPGEVPGINDQDATGENGSAALTLDGVVVSEKTREFVADVKSVVFSSPELVDVSKVESETTVGGIKESRGLDVQYSAELTEEQIAEINAQTVVAGDWALISVQPFESTESLTVTMKTGEVFEIRVTDAQLKKTVKTASGETWEITITYDDSAEIPKDAELRVEEILPEDERYEQYYQQSLEKISVGEVPDTIEDESGSEMIDETAETASEEAATTTSYAHIFDIQIWAGDQQIEPASGSTVSVSIKLLDAPENEDTNLQVVHFGKDGLEVMELAENNDETKAGGTELNFVTDEFSVYAIVGTEVITTEFLSADGNTYEVTVTYGPEAEIPEGAKLIVTEYAEGSREFKEAKEALIGNAVDNDNGWFYPELREENYVAPAFVGEDGGISLLDISIVDQTGIEIEPKAPVSVVVKMKELPADTETDILENSMELKHFVENEDNDSVEVESLANTVNIYGETGGEITVNSDSVVAEFDTESFSLFAFTWGSRTANVIVHYVDEDGNDIQGTQTSDVSVSPTNTNMSFSTYEGGITNYTFKEARLGKLNGEVVTGFISSGFSNTNASSGTVTFTNGTTTVQAYQVPFNTEVYFVYTKDDSGQGGGGTPGLKPPTTEKKLESAGDGTYTISLSVTGTAETDTVNTKANVIVIYDTSNSMNYQESSGGRYVATGGNWGRYGLINGEYVQLYTYNSWWGYNPITTTYGGYYETVYYQNGSNYTQYSGARYNYEAESTTRHAVASAAVKDLGEALLSNNTNQVPDMVEMALIEFDSIGYRINGGRVSRPGAKTRSYSTFEGWVNNINVPGSNAQNAGGTNWEDALTLANNYSFGDNDPVYIIFISDGNPTFRVSRNGSSGQGGANSSQTVSMNNRSITVYGEGNADTGNYNLDAAIKMATTIVKSNKHLYSVGAFGDATNMQRLAGAYYDANNQTALNQAFADIVGSITSSLTFANVEITDGLTAMTASTFVSGEVGNFIYYKDGEIWTEEQMSAAGANGASVVYDEDGNQSVVWSLGENYKLDKNVEYKVEFTVWPKQEAYDLLAALNNGLIEWGEDYTYKASDGSTKTIKASDYESQILKDGNTYSVLTNTDAGISYDIVTEEDGVETGRQSGTGTIDNPNNGMGLDESAIKVKKVWNDSLDPTQLLKLLESNPNYKVVLEITNDNNDYVPVTIEPVITRDGDGKVTGATWPEKTVYIAPGVMLSLSKAQAKGIKVENYTQLEYNGTTYVILESGHDYSIDEQNTDYHFELAAQTYHPMVVDGEVRNVTFTYSDSGSMTGITAIDTNNTGSLTATNDLRAGINMRKIVLDANGNEIYPESQTFKLKVSLKDKTGKAIKFSDYPGSATSEYFKPDGTKEAAGINWDTYPIWFNIYSGANDDMDLENEYDDSAISPGMVVEDGGYIFLKAGEVIRFANVPIGTQFSFVEEDVPTGYDFTKYEYKAGKANQSWTTEETQADGYGDTAIANQSYYLKITNTKKVIDVRINKKDQEGKISLKDAKFDLYPENAVDNDWKLKTGQTPITGYTDLVTDNNGQATLHEVPMGTYFLVEKKAPAGFNLLEKAIKVEVTTDGVKFTQSDQNGGLTQNAEATEVDGVLTYDIIVINNSGVELPMTGGSGTLPYTLGGIVLIMASALMYGFRMRRRERRLN